MSRIEDGVAVEAGLVERLEAWASVIEANDDCPAAGHTMHEAAAEITRLRAENAGMREALKPFAFERSALDLSRYDDENQVEVRIPQSGAISAFRSAASRSATSAAPARPSPIPPKRKDRHHEHPRRYPVAGRD